MVAMWELGAALAALGWGVANLMEAGMFLDDYNRFVALSRRSVDQIEAFPNGQELPRLVGPDTVALDGVSFRYPGSAALVLGDVHLAVAPGEVVALVGPSGAGKSTVLKVLTGLYQPSSGVVRWAGAPVSAQSAVALRHRVSVMLQDFGRYSLTVRENIALHDVARVEDTDAVIDAARIAGIHEFVTGLPDGYQTRLGVEFDGGVDLSVGQWQRLALARALFARCDVLVLDEPTSALDPETERQFIRRLRKACAQQAVILISHRFSTVHDVDRIYVISSGRVVESGSHDELLASRDVYWQLFSGDAQFSRDAQSFSGDAQSRDACP
jgi:ATP-binding cassette subfamily B protein